MHDANKLKYILIENLPSPEGIFDMVMEYGFKANKPAWKVYRDVFNPVSQTVVLMDDNDNYIGYGSGNIVGDNNDEFFLNHGYLRNGVINKDKIIDNIANTVANKFNIRIKKVTMTSDLDPRLWHMWGFKEDKMIAYIKDIE